MIESYFIARFEPEKNTFSTKRQHLSDSINCCGKGLKPIDATAKNSSLASLVQNAIHKAVISMKYLDYWHCH